MDDKGQSETQVTSGNYSYEKANKTSRYSGLKNTSDLKRNGTAMQVAMAGAINAVTVGPDYSNGGRAWNGTDALQGSPNLKMPNHQNSPANFYCQRNGGIIDPNNLAPTFCKNVQNFIGKKFGFGGREYRAIQPLILNKRVKGKLPYTITATYGGSVFYDHL